MSSVRREPSALTRSKLRAFRSHHAPDLHSFSAQPESRDTASSDDRADRLSILLSSIPDLAVFTTDSGGRITSWSDGAERLLRYSHSAVMGRSRSIFVAPADERTDETRRIRQTAVREGRSVEEAWWTRKDGSRFLAHAVTAALPGAGGRQRDFGVIVRDITDQKDTQARLREAERMASIGTLAAGLGHDMNNMLLPVRAHLNALLAAEESRAFRRAQRVHIEEIRKSVAYLQQLADGLHYLALDPDNDDEPPDAESVDLSQWWSQVGALLSKAASKQVRIVASIPDGLPPVALAAHGLTQAVLNLIVNASDAVGPRKSGKGRRAIVRVWARAEPDSRRPEVRLGVTDNGSGMSEEVKRRAFEMFYTTKPRGLGTGLGLALVRKVVARAGGRVEIESAPGKGTSVQIIVPAHIPSLNEGDLRQAFKAVISVADPRRAAFIRNLFKSSGVFARAGADPDDASIWVLEPLDSLLSRAREWRKQDSQRRLVLFGKPSSQSASEWRLLRPAVISAPDNLQSVSSALRLALKVG